VEIDSEGQIHKNFAYYEVSASRHTIPSELLLHETVSDGYSVVTK